jgi:PAS domain S-box-containing protein
MQEGGKLRHYPPKISYPPEYSDWIRGVISPIFIILLIVSLAELFIANYIFYKGQASAFQRLAAGRCLSAGLFSLLSAFFYSSISYNEASFWNQARTLPLLILPALTFLFSWYWTQQKNTLAARILNIFISASMLGFMVASLLTDIAGFPARQSEGVWITISSSELFWPIVVSAWTVTLLVCSILLAIFYYFNIDRATERKIQLPIFLGLAGNALPVLLVGLLPGPSLPDFLVYLPAWVLISDILIGLGLTSRQFFSLNFTSSFYPILQSMQEAVALVGLDIKIRAANAAFCRLVERTEMDLIDQPLDEILLSDQFSQDRLKEKPHQEGTNQSELEIRLKTGKSLSAQVVTTPIFDKFSRMGGIAVIITDNSRLKETDLKFESTQLETRQKFSLQINELKNANNLLEDDLRRYKLEEMQWRRRVFELESLTNLSSLLRTARSVQEMLAILLRETAHILEADFGMILLRKGNDLVVKSLHGIAEDLKGHSHPFERDVFWKVFESGQPAFAEVGRVEIPAFFPEAASVTVFPLKTSEKQLGLFVLGFRAVKAFNEADQRLIEAIGNIASNALYRSNAMDSLEQRVVSRNRELETLYQVASLANEAKEAGSILGQTLHILMETLNAKAGVIYLNDKLNEVHIAARPAEYLAEIEDDLKGIAIENSIWRFIYHTNQPLLVQSLDDDNRIDVGIVTELLALGNCSCIGSPVRGSNETIGAICLFKDAELPFGPEDLALLSTAAHQLGIAIEIIRLRKLEEKNAIGAERQRLAGELHDSISQLLSSQFLYAEASQNLIQSGDRATAQEYLDQIRKASHQALKEMRLLIHELRPAPIESLGLYGALQHRLETVERRAHIEAALTGDYGFRLPGNMEESLYMIAQDALNYSIKNSQATQVNVRLDSDYDSILLEVKDNGLGADPLGSKEKNGLSRMRERIENLGGVLKVETIPGQGSTLRITI